MRRFLMVIGLLCFGSTAMYSANTSAQIWGWASYGFSVLNIDVITKKTPNPTRIPTIMTITTNSFTVEISCVNPANNGVFNGNSFSPTEQVLLVESLANVDKAGKTTTHLEFPLEEYETNAYCVNSNWYAMGNSAMVTAIDFTARWFRCTGSYSEADGDPCFNGDVPQYDPYSTPLDAKKGTCTLDETPYPRGDNGEANHNAVLTCSVPQPAI